jgi:hypothetical protein
LNSNVELHALKRNTNLLNWLKHENITLDRNPLASTLKPQQLGFFTHMVVRADQTSMYECRVTNHTTEKCPPFFLQPKHLKAQHAKTKVWNVYSDSIDTDQIIKELKNAYNTPSLR